jgi:hypothetical protein
MGGDQELRAQLLRLALEAVEDLALQVDVQARVGLVQQDRCRRLAEQEGQQRQRLVRLGKTARGTAAMG